MSIGLYVTVSVSVNYVCLRVCFVSVAMASAAIDEGGRRAAVAVGEFLNKVKTFALDIKAKVT